MVENNNSNGKALTENYKKFLVLHFHLLNLKL